MNKRNLIEAVRPKIAVATANHGNEYEHPDRSVCEMLAKQGVDLCTTKHGDVIIESIQNHNANYKVTDLIGGAEKKVGYEETFRSKKIDILKMNPDSIRNLYNPGYKKKQ